MAGVCLRRVVFSSNGSGRESEVRTEPLIRPYAIYFGVSFNNLLVAGVLSSITAVPLSVST